MDAEIIGVSVCVCVCVCVCSGDAVFAAQRYISLSGLNLSLAAQRYISLWS